MHIICNFPIQTENTHWIDICETNGNLLASGGRDATIKIFDKRRAKIVKTFGDIHAGKKIICVIYFVTVNFSTSINSFVNIQRRYQMCAVEPRTEICLPLHLTMVQLNYWIPRLGRSFIQSLPQIRVCYSIEIVSILILLLDAVTSVRFAQLWDITVGVRGKERKYQLFLRVKIKVFFTWFLLQNRDSSRKLSSIVNEL